MTVELEDCDECAGMERDPHLAEAVERFVIVDGPTEVQVDDGSAVTTWTKRCRCGRVWRQERDPRVDPVTRWTLLSGEYRPNE